MNETGVVHLQANENKNLKMHEMEKTDFFCFFACICCCSIFSWAKSFKNVSFCTIATIARNGLYGFGPVETVQCVLYTHLIRCISWSCAHTHSNRLAAHGNCIFSKIEFTFLRLWNSVIYGNSRLSTRWMLYVNSPQNNISWKRKLAQTIWKAFGFTQHQKIVRTSVVETSNKPYNMACF